MIDFEVIEENRRLYQGYTLQRTDPYGFWIILDSKSRTPKGLQGSFTNPQDAGKAVKNWVDNQKKA